MSQNSQKLILKQSTFSKVHYMGYYYDLFYVQIN